MDLVAYVVKQGDYLTKLAHRMGFDADTIWNDPKNADLKKTRPNPDILCPGDVLFVPAPDPTKLDVSIGGSNKYSAEVPTITVALTVAQDGSALSGADYFVEGLAQETKGTTDGDGTVKFDAPVTVREVAIVFPKQNLRYPVHIGDLDPIEEDSGVRMRLLHLGHYGWFPPPGFLTDDDAFADALRDFQSANNIDATGVLDDATRSALGDKHKV